MKNTLSIVICTKNEALNISDCVISASFADEVLVVDSGSTDDTVDIAKKLGARVLETDWPGYGPQQNKAIDASKGDWIYSIDADERITPELKTEILNVITHEEHKVYDVPRKSFFITKFMNHSGWWPDRTRRLFKRGFARFTTHEIHANLSTSFRVGHLKSHMIHYSYKNCHEVLEKMNRYSSGSANDMLANGKNSSLPKALAHGFWAFFRTYFIKLGFLDGQAGLILAIANAESSYYKHLKLYLLSQQ
ncbi:glycosyltransferase family 2 protein [Candidatus Methylopumilus turicensis]|uniref:Candidate b-1,4-glucosyltransferase, Glycosyltransferase Family 2 n=1 Tax=Candidatus Methylopumilus turicensis TaxID=1581680 RepID=A0A0B7IZ14_9PROT|nr:glycosyltransferase family 2 protein [Candidatus Methylopumilus turicensis]CEN56349.1 Candidate b-1,4-glucosyltransferase, Glycosyltransferase Family 2 [Candidatus Methylopumilus turicensis]